MAVVKLEEASESDGSIFETDTIIDVEVKEIATRDVPGRDGKPSWSKFEFKFLIKGVPTYVEAEYGALVGTPIWGSVSTRFSTHPDNKLRQWAEALLNMGELPAGFELDTDMLLGRRARAITTQYKKRDGGVGHQVGGLLVSATATATPTEPWSSAAATSAPLQTNPWGDEAPF